MSTAAAESLLDWLDGSSPEPVMQTVHRWVEQQQGELPPLSLCVDVTALMCEDVQLAITVMHDTRNLSEQVQGLINQQLAVAAAEPAAVASTLDMAELEPSTIRTHLKMTAVPLPLRRPTEVQQEAMQLSSSSSSSKQTAPSDNLLLASVLAVVSGFTAPGQVVHSQRFCCPACNTVVDLPVHQHSLPCCSLPKTARNLQEDVTGRVMVPCQQLWVSDVGGASRAEYGCSLQPLLVHAPEDQVGWPLGAVVHIIGHCSLHTAAGSTCAIQMHANNIQLQLPQLLWSLPPASLGSITGQQRQQPLQLLWDLLTAALGYQTTIDPHVALALLSSAACMGSTAAGQQQQQHGAVSQVNLLLLHEGCSPCTLRQMRQAALLLSPQSVALPVPLAEQVLPITAAGTADEQAGSLFASLLHLVNTGVAVADLATLPGKSRQQLLEALQQRRTPVPAGLAPAAGASQSLTATCWAAAAWPEVCSDSGLLDAVKPSKKTSAAASAKNNYQGFDLLIGDNTVHEEDLFASMGPASSRRPGQVQQEDAEEVLRYLVAAAALCDSPVLTDAAQAFLGQYFLLLRQSLGSSSKLSKPPLLASLVRVAAGVARLHQRSSVLETPDTAVAVLLMEQSLANRLGSGYVSLLELPADLQPTNERSLDEQVQLLHGLMQQTLKQHCGGDDGASGEDVGWYARADEGSDCSSAGGRGC